MWLSCDPAPAWMTTLGNPAHRRGGVMEAHVRHARLNPPRFLSIGIAGATVTLLSACGGGAAPSAPAKPAEPAPPAATTAPAAPAAPAKPVADAKPAESKPAAQAAPAKTSGNVTLTWITPA